MKRVKKQSDRRRGIYSKITGGSLAKEPFAPFLKAEERAQLPWILTHIEKYFGRKVKVLDMGLSEGLLADHIALFGHSVIRVDLDEERAKRAEKEGQNYTFLGESTHLAFSSRSFDVILAPPILDGSEETERIIREANRLLIHRGLFFFYTFNRTYLSYLLFRLIRRSVKGWNPYPLFLKPDELKALCEKNSLMVKKTFGLRPEVNFHALFKLIAKKKEIPELRFTVTSNLLFSYGGVAVKEDVRVKIRSSCVESELFVKSAS